MLKLLALLFGIAHAQTALPTSPSYLIFSSQALCLSRSQAMCTAMGCDGVHTIYWWDCQTGPMSNGIVGPNAVTSGSFAMRISSGSIYYGAHTSNAVSGGIQGLTTSEAAKLVPYTSISSLVHPNAAPNAVP